MFSLFLSLMLVGQPAAVPRLRVCADPANMPFSDRSLRGFENEIAAVLARDLHTQLQYVWIPESRRVIRNTLDASRCDVLLGVPVDLPGVLATAPYYRSSYVFVTRKDAGRRVRTFDDPVLRTARIGVPIAGDEYAPPAAALGRRGIVRNIHGYPLSGGGAESQFRILNALAKNEIDVAIVWGPVAGYYARHARLPIEITPIPRQPGPVPMQFSIALGVKKGNVALQQQLDSALQRDSAAIRRTLEQFGVPLV
jgi:mxaJ protein